MSFQTYGTQKDKLLSMHWLLFSVQLNFLDWAIEALKRQMHHKSILKGIHYKSSFKKHKCIIKVS